MSNHKYRIDGLFGITDNLAGGFEQIAIGALALIWSFRIEHRQHPSFGDSAVVDDMQ